MAGRRNCRRNWKGDRMVVENIVLKDRFMDSVYLMSVSNELKGLDGIIETSLMMGTPNNLEILKSSRLLNEKGEAARPNDLVIAIKAKDKSVVNSTLKAMDAILTRKESSAAVKDSSVCHDIESAGKALGGGLVFISLPGPFVKREAMKALKAGNHLMIFSDNVTLEEELEIKNFAKRKGLLVMGPDCGTAIIGGKALGFANAIRSGKIGIVGAAGTGIQEVSVLIDRLGEGISHALGTGGRDLSKEIGGITMLQAMDFMLEDKKISVIVLISKPPSEEVAKKILSKAKKSGKPFVVNFIGEKSSKKTDGNLHFAETLEEAAVKAVSLLKGKSAGDFENESFEAIAGSERKKLGKGKKYLRGIYSGGTLCQEAILVLKKAGREIYSNISKDKNFKLKDSNKSEKDSLVDIGEDEFTRGIPHPMIDNTLRCKRILQEASDSKVGLLLPESHAVYHNPADPF
ncbi:MAG: hypothetical protein M1165_00620 [Candidatus Pacearchaeota archaeon]|nr:hypothetical protein [Candidatus Pacearchaeota archaeon]